MTLVAVTKQHPRQVDFGKVAEELSIVTKAAA